MVKHWSQQMSAVINNTYVIHNTSRSRLILKIHGPTPLNLNLGIEALATHMYNISTVNSYAIYSIKLQS